jgi:hypothetical protein
MLRAVALVVVAAFLLLGRPTASEAEIYRWIDDRGVANYSEGIDSVPLKYRATAVPMGFRTAPPPPAGSGPATPGPAAGAGPTQIKFTPGKPIVVDARLNGTTSVQLLLDTGAQRTMINPRVLAAAGVAVKAGEAALIRGATGTATVGAVQLDSLEVGPIRVDNLAVLAHDVEQEGIDGLLGRDFLDRVRVAIDNTAGIVTLSPK